MKDEARTCFCTNTCTGTMAASEDTYHQDDAGRTHQMKQLVPMRVVMDGTTGVVRVPMAVMPEAGPTGMPYAAISLRELPDGPVMVMMIQRARTGGEKATLAQPCPGETVPPAATRTSRCEPGTMSSGPASLARATLKLKDPQSRTK